METLNRHFSTDSFPPRGNVLPIEHGASLLGDNSRNDIAKNIRLGRSSQPTVTNDMTGMWRENQ